jgi:hypothetical protein
MSTPLHLGLWPAARHLHLAMIHPGAHRPHGHLRFERSLQGRIALAEQLAPRTDLVIIVPELLLRFDPIAAHLHGHSSHLWLAPPYLVEHLLRMLAVRPTAHRTLATALARLPTLPLLRPALRPLLSPEPRQLRLPLPHSS